MAGSESTIGALLDETGGSIKTGPFGTKLKASEYTATGVPVISVGEVGFGRLRVHHDTPRVDETVSSRMPEFLLKAGDIVFGRKGAVERSAQVQPDEDGYFLGSDGIRIRLNVEECDPKFISYQLQTTAHRSWMIQHAAGTTMPSLNEGIIRRIPIILKPLAEQKAIAAVLGALDDKIELNRRMNATLEAMARALFQSWFVDFDPVRAKLDGRPPAALDPATAALFPDSFVETTAGHIPHGWRVGSIYEVANVIYGAPFASSLFNSEKVGKPLIRIRDLPNESPAVFTTEVHPKGYLLQPGDIAVGMDGEFRAYLWAGVESWLNQRVCVFVPKPGYSAAFVRNSIIDPLAQVEATETATTVIHIGKNDIDRFTVIIPNATVAEAFKRQCQPWYDQIVANKQQSRTLATLRDTLLPKLLSGELSVDHLLPNQQSYP
jgi:type I restriction enzyme S subunit